MRICPPRAHKDCFDVGVVVQIVLKGRSHGFGITSQIQMICVDGQLYKVLDFGEWMRRHDIDGLQLVRQRRCRLDRVCVQGGEIEDKED